jgi:hypothetical protein
MLRATRSLITSLPHVGEVRVIEGRTHIADGSELALLHPDAFEPVPGRAVGARERTLAMHGSTVTIRTPAPPAGLGVERWRISEQSQACRLGYGTAQVRIRLSADARATILQIIAQTTARDGLEVGGTLSGPPFAPADGVMELVHAYGPGTACHRSRSGFTPDVEFDVKLADEIAERSGGAEVMQAGFHVHPGGSREASGEGGDLVAWSALRTQVCDVDTYAGLIAVPTSDGTWEFEGFVVGAGHRQDLAQRARIT